MDHGIEAPTDREIRQKPRAGSISIDIQSLPAGITIRFSDDGQGIPDSADLGRFVARGHFGLAGMRERAAMIGGNLDIQSALDYGTAVILQVPC